MLKKIMLNCVFILISREDHMRDQENVRSLCENSISFAELRIDTLPAVVFVLNSAILMPLSHEKSRIAGACECDEL